MGFFSKLLVNVCTNPAERVLWTIEKRSPHIREHTIMVFDFIFVSDLARRHKITDDIDMVDEAHSYIMPKYLFALLLDIYLIGKIPKHEVLTELWAEDIGANNVRITMTNGMYVTTKKTLKGIMDARGDFGIEYPLIFDGAGELRADYINTFLNGVTNEIHSRIENSDMDADLLSYKVVEEAYNAF